MKKKENKNNINFKRINVIFKIFKTNSKNLKNDEYLTNAKNQNYKNKHKVKLKTIVMLN